jgi:DNA-directed RNA polymerase specialized sigma24 family protein
MLILRYMLGWQVQEIAAHMEKNANTIAQAIKRSLDQVRHTWKLEGATTYD